MRKYTVLPSFGPSSKMDSQDVEARSSVDEGGVEAEHESENRTVTNRASEKLHNRGWLLEASCSQ